MRTPRLSALAHSQIAKRQHLVLRDNPEWLALLRVVLELATLRKIGVEELQALAGVAFTAGYWRGLDENFGTGTTPGGATVPRRPAGD